MRSFSSQRSVRRESSPNRRRKRRSPHTRLPERQLRLEPLEQRVVLSGIVTTSIEAGDAGIAEAAYVQGDDKIVLAGESNSTYSGGDFAIVRYNADGILDETFGDEGVVTTPIGRYSDTAYAATPYPGNKILLAGSAADTVNGTDADFAMAMYNLDGSLDTTFGGKGKNAGKVQTDLGGYDRILDVLVQPDGAIVVAGEQGDRRFTVARYTAAGKLDTSFGGDGVVETAFAEKDLAKAVVMHEGKILVAGHTVGEEWDFALARYNLDGSLDTTFDGDGKLTTNFGFSDEVVAMAIDVDPDGNERILVLGNVQDSNGMCRFGLARYMPDGTLDPAFGVDGLAVADFGGRGPEPSDLEIAVDGSIVVAGNTDDPDGQKFAVARFTSEGVLDPNFGDNGTVVTPILANDWGRSVSLQSDGRIVVSGSADDASGTRFFAMVRYDAYGVLDETFGTHANRPPTAVDDEASTLVDTPISIDVLDNDSDPDGDTLSITSLGAAAFGTVTDNGDGTVDYTPNQGFEGEDSFTYTISDGNPETADATATVRVTVAPNSPPVAVNDSGSTFEGVPLTIDVLGNDSDPDGHEIAVIAVTDGLHGVVANNGDGTVTYTPSAGYTGPDAFTYTVTDGFGGATVGSVNVQVDEISSTLEYTSTGDPITIRDSKTVSSPIEVSGTGATVGTLTIRIDLTHANADDLTAQLISPTGSTLPINSAIVAGDYSHSYLVTGAAGQPVGGTWTLQVTDNTRDKKQGSLIEWTMVVELNLAGAAMAASTGESTSATPAPVTKTSTDGSTLDAPTFDALSTEQKTTPVAAPTTDKTKASESSIDEAIADLDLDPLENQLLVDLALAVL